MQLHLQSIYAIAFMHFMQLQSLHFSYSCVLFMRVQSSCFCNMQLQSGSLCHCNNLRNDNLSGDCLKLLCHCNPAIHAKLQSIYAITIYACTVHSKTIQSHAIALCTRPDLLGKSYPGCPNISYDKIRISLKSYVTVPGTFSAMTGTFLYVLGSRSF